MISPVIPWPTSVTTSEQLGPAGTQRNQGDCGCSGQIPKCSGHDRNGRCQRVVRTAVTPDVCEEQILGSRAVQGCDSVEGKVQEPTTPR